MPSNKTTKEGTTTCITQQHSRRTTVVAVVWEEEEGRRERPRVSGGVLLRRKRTIVCLFLSLSLCRSSNDVKQVLKYYVFLSTKTLDAAMLRLHCRSSTLMLGAASFSFGRDFEMLDLGTFQNDVDKI